MLTNLNWLTPTLNFHFKVGERIGNPQNLNDCGEIAEDQAQNKQPTNASSNQMGNMPVKPAQNKTQGYGSSTEKSDIITHPIVSLTPYQNKYATLVIYKQCLLSYPGFDY